MADEPNQSSEAIVPSSTSRRDARRRRWEEVRWWIKLVLTPLLFFAVGVLLIVLLGVAQRIGWISSGGGSGVANAGGGAAAVEHICPMMCVPPQLGPGRCPVCGMELVPASSSGGKGDGRSIHVDAVTRRIANIQTTTVKEVSLTRQINAIGELHYDEGKRKTIAAYVEGRLDKLYADFTGVQVERDEPLALLYSPDLYSGQVAYLLARAEVRRADGQTLASVRQANDGLLQSARQNLVELGMTTEQITELDRRGKAESRTKMVSPISGTVIEKTAEEGEYLKRGQTIYRLADLSTVWLMLKLFPEDAAAIGYGQKVTAEFQSLPGREFIGRVAFVDPDVEPKTRTVNVRVVIENPNGLLRIGDYATATIDMPVVLASKGPRTFYDEELAGKWISPRHPHIIASEPGKCPICNVDLAPASNFGFVDEPLETKAVLSVPRSAVLRSGSTSLAYVETDRGRFEIRKLEVGPTRGASIVVLRGLKAGEQVAVSGNFLLDSQMQLAGNPSLIDPKTLVPSVPGKLPPDVVEVLATLSGEDRALATKQLICPVSERLLGQMGVPIKIDVDGEQIFICCKGCRDRMLDDSAKYIDKLEAFRRRRVAENERSASGLPPIGPIQPIDQDDATPSVDNLPPITEPIQVEETP